MSIFQRMFQRYIHGKVTDQEKGMIEGWYDTYDHAPLNEMSRNEEKEIKASLWLKLNNSLLHETDYTPLSTVISMRTRWLRYSAAAVVAGTLITGAWWINGRKATPSYTSIAAGSGQHKKVNLPDGSTVMLNANSRIDIPGNYNKETREIFMPHGEVFYDVAKDNRRPFLIHSGELTIRVLGTSFHIRLLKGLNEQEVLVKNGSVQVMHGDSVMGILKEGNRLLYDNSNGQVIIQENKQRMIDHMEHRWIVFDNASFTTLTAIIHNHYNIQINDPQHKLATAHFTAAFEPQASLKDILNVLSSIHGVTYKITKNQVIIK